MKVICFVEKRFLFLIKPFVKYSIQIPYPELQKQDSRQYMAKTFRHSNEVAIKLPPPNLASDHFNLEAMIETTTILDLRDAERSFRHFNSPAKHQFWREEQVLKAAPVVVNMASDNLTTLEPEETTENPQILTSTDANGRFQAQQRRIDSPLQEQSPAVETIQRNALENELEIDEGTMPFNVTNSLVNALDSASAPETTSDTGPDRTSGTKTSERINLSTATFEALTTTTAPLEILKKQTTRSLAVGTAFGSEILEGKGQKGKGEIWVNLCRNIVYY